MFDPDNLSPQGGGGLPAEANGLSPGAKQFVRQYVPADDDEGVIPTFGNVSEYKPFKSKELNREIFEDVLYIRINIRGDDKIEVHRPATDADKRRFPYAWQEFQKGEEARARGTPLEKLGIDAPLIRGFHAKNVFTVEDLAKVSDNNLSNLGIGARETRARASEYLRVHQAANENSETISALREDSAKKDAQIAQLIAAVEALREQAPLKRGPGRPPKEPQGE